MEKYFKYIKTFFFGIAALSVVGFLNSNPLESIARTYLNVRGVGNIYREMMDVVLLVSLIYFIIQIWMNLPKKAIYELFSLVYISLILLDIYVWLWWTQYSWLYYYATFVHSLPILILIKENQYDRILKRIFLVGVVVLIMGFLFDIVFINIPYPDMTDELYEETIKFERIRNMIYYVGFVMLAVGLINKIEALLVKSKVINT